MKEKMNMKSPFIPNLIVVLSLVLLINGCGPQPQPAEEEPAEPSAETFPEFPWPPPRASASMIIPLSLTKDPDGSVANLGNVSDKLTQALEESGYVEKSFYTVPGGFAIVTRIEQIDPDGSPKKVPDRWSTEIKPLQEFSLRQYLKALFRANPGLFRIVVFIVTPHPFSQSEKVINRDEAMDLLWEGGNTLPPSIADQEYTDEFTTTALVYEFKKPESEEAMLSMPSQLTGKVHLDKSGFMRNLEEK